MVSDELILVFIDSPLQLHTIKSAIIIYCHKIEKCGNQKKYFFPEILFVNAFKSITYNFSQFDI